ncbi:hypothetical protein LTR62_000166 [Meristemomyces frigidus]|uniref:Homeobox domain-containing protein n=1 Tax=Meristemomyces frigidus TaxID=1508187 RepID=A0AAN7TK50_9PEZI|nr:hypothetical protein LTR62_000166 [Meristemomyces frigidus]
MAEVMPLSEAPQLQIEVSSPDSASDDGKLQMGSAGGMSGNANNARRPPRKSTLTQQQKNQKRQRATQEQLMLLEVEFIKNPTPTALVRERIASEIDMTERSVQIWFQNRRAKIKNIAKRSIESGEDCDSIPESMRQYLAMQAYGPGGKGFAASMLGRGGGFGSYGPGTLMLNADNATGKVVIQHFACRSLSVGTWRRVGQSTMDLVVFYSPDKACITYYINNENVGYKIEYPFAWIKNISLEQGDVLSAAEGASQRSGGLVIELTRPPKFYMDSSGQGGFYECGDFTEDQQATRMMVHHLGGPSKVLSGQLAKLISLESYQNRHMSMFDPTQFAVSAPVSPMRPASQPNHMIHPHHAQPMDLFQQEAIGVGLMGPPAPRGHKRQRSRSVPAAIDMSMLRHPMPSFLIQHEQPSAHPLMQDPNIFAPIPQHHAPPQFAPGSGLSIDTSAGYGMHMPFGGPMSATTANSPSEFGTPGFFTSGPPPDAMQAAHFGPAYNNGFLQVDAGAMLGTSNTPLSITSHADPIIADHSPPLSGMGRSASADIFSTPGEHSQFGDEGLYLSENFNKSIQLPFRSPMSEQAFHSPMPNGSFDFQSPPGTSQSQLHNPFDGSMPPNFDMPQHQTHDPSLLFHSTPTHNNHLPQNHQDSGVSFSTPSHMSRGDHSKDNGMLYNDSKVYTSPAQMHRLVEDEQSLYQNSPLAHTTNGDEFLYIDPNHLGQQSQQ